MDGTIRTINGVETIELTASIRFLREKEDTLHFIRITYTKSLTAEDTNMEVVIPPESFDIVQIPETIKDYKSTLCTIARTYPHEVYD
jgi:hypothetical protein